MAKQALFNILANRCRFEDLRVLDLFAGTGAIGFEFLSRGSSVVLVESNRKAALELARNAREMEFSRAEVRTQRVEAFIAKATSAFDLISAVAPRNPPYGCQCEPPRSGRAANRGASATLCNGGASGRRAAVWRFRF